MKKTIFIFLIVFLTFFKIDAQTDEPSDDLLKVVEKTPKEASEPEKSIIQNQVESITEELKKFNSELKKLLGPDAEKQISEAKKRRQDRQKEAERRLKEYKGGRGDYYPSSYGGKGGHPSYGPSYSPSHGKSYSGGGFGDSFGGGFGEKYPWEKDLDRGKFGKEKEKSDVTSAGAKSDTTKLDETKEDKKKKSGDSKDSDQTKEEKSALTKIKSYTSDIKDILKQIMQDLGDIQVSQERKAEATDQIYSNLLSEGPLSELKDLMSRRKEAARSLSKGKSTSPAQKIRGRVISQSKEKPKVVIDQEEKSLWNKFLPHLMQFFVFSPESEDMAAPSQQNIDLCKNIIKQLEREKLIARENVKLEQEKIESQLVKDLQSAKEKMPKGTEDTSKLQKIAQKAHNLPMPKGKNLTEMLKKITPTPHEKGK